MSSHITNRNKFICLIDSHKRVVVDWLAIGWR